MLARQQWWADERLGRSRCRRQPPSAPHPRPGPFFLSDHARGASQHGTELAQGEGGVRLNVTNTSIWCVAKGNCTYACWPQGPVRARGRWKSGGGSSPPARCGAGRDQGCDDPAPPKCKERKDNRGARASVAEGAAAAFLLHIENNYAWEAGCRVRVCFMGHTNAAVSSIRSCLHRPNVFKGILHSRLSLGSTLLGGVWRIKSERRSRRGKIACGRQSTLPQLHAILLTASITAVDSSLPYPE